MVVRDIAPLYPALPQLPPPEKPAPQKEDRAVPPANRLPPVTPPPPDGASFAAMLRKPVVRARHRPQDLAVGARAPGLDDTTWKRLSRGRLKVDARLDLHGYVVQEAFERLHDFMHRARMRNWRCVEVVTGLGSGQTSGLIRRELPLWLQRSDLRPMVLAVVHPHAANHGSVRILLRTRHR
nr:Smr/MutS family protein [Gluconobacter morbifer]